MATDDTFRANMKAMLLDPGQREEVRKMLNLGGENLPVTPQVKSVESRSFKRLDKYDDGGGLIGYRCYPALHG